MGMLHLFPMTLHIRRTHRLLTAFVCSAAIVTSLCTLTTAQASFYTGGGIDVGVTAATAITGVGTNTPATTINNVINVFVGYVGTFALAVIVVAGMYLILGFGNETSKETAKKIILYAAIGIAVVALANEIVALFQALPTGTDVSGGLELRPRVITIINLIFKYVAMLLLVVIFIAGLIMLTSGGDDTRRDTSRKIIIYALIGTAILVFAKALASAIVTIFS